MTKTILLVNPWIYDFAAYDLWAFPLGLLRIAAYLKDNEKVNLEFLNFLERGEAIALKKQKDNSKTAAFGTGHFLKEEIEKPAVVSSINRKFFRYGLPPEFIEKKIKHLRPDLILVTSAMTYWYVGVKETVALLKKCFPGCPIILGGTYAILCPEHARENIGADSVFSGSDIGQIIRCVNNHGVSLKVNAKDDRMPLFLLLRSQKALPILSGFGCPFNCAYCASKIIYPFFIQRPAEKIIDEIIYCVKNFNTKDFAFYDDALLANGEKFIKPILRGVIKSGESIRFHTPNGLHARFIDKELAHLMFLAGFKILRLSLESSTQFLDDKNDNKVTNEDLQKAVGFLLSAGFKKENIGVYTLMGFPGQKKEDIEADMKFINALGVEIHLSSYSLVPRSKEWEYYVKKGLIEKNTDPLLLSHTAFPLLFTDFNASLMKKSRDYAGILNRN